MKYYSDITNELYETREQLFKAERDYKTELLEKARTDEKAKKIADLEAQLAELRGETTAKTTNTKPSDTSDIYTGAVKESANLSATEKPEEDNSAPTKVYNAGREDKIDYSKTVEEIKKLIDRFKFKYPSFEFQDVEEEDDKDELTVDDIKEDTKSSAPKMNIKTAPAKTNSSCGGCGKKCVKNSDTDGDKVRSKLADSGYYSSAYVNLNGKEFYSEGADSWNDVKKAVREYFDKLQGLK